MRSKVKIGRSKLVGRQSTFGPMFSSIVKHGELEKPVLQFFWRPSSFVLLVGASQWIFKSFCLSKREKIDVSNLLTSNDQVTTSSRFTAMMTLSRGYCGSWRKNAATKPSDCKAAHRLATAERRLLYRLRCTCMYIVRRRGHRGELWRQWWCS